MENFLEGFKQYYMAGGAPTATFSKNGLGISKAAVAKLNNADYVRILFNKKAMQMALMVCGEGDDGAARFAREKKDGARWNSRDLAQTIREMTHWVVDGSQRYTVTGEYVEVEETPDFSKAILSHDQADDV